jgi:hypothetical protein
LAAVILDRVPLAPVAFAMLIRFLVDRTWRIGPRDRPQ